MSAQDTLEQLERELFHFTKTQTIALSVGIVLALALAGLLAGTVLEAPQVELESPAGGDGEMVGAAAFTRVAGTEADTTLGGEGIVLAASHTKELSAAGKALAQTLAPEPVPTSPGTSPSPAAPVSPAPGVSPTPAPAVSPTPAISPTPDPLSGSTTGIDLNGIVTIPTPAPWAVTYSDPTQAVLVDGRNNFIFGLTGGADPATDAASLLLTVFNNVVVSQEQMSQIAIGDVQQIQPFGSITSAAVMPYQGLWTDTQSSFPLMGGIWVAVRADGTAFAMTAETAPPEDWSASEAEWGPVVNGAYASFAGLQ